MSYATIEKQIKAVPAEYLDEISEYIDYILFKANNKKTMKANDSVTYFGCLKKSVDGLSIQRDMRDEWN